MKIVQVYEDKYGSTRCGNCDEELLCDKNGDMPHECPCCYSMLDYSFYDNKQSPSRGPCMRAESEEHMKKFPKYVKTYDGYIGVFSYLDFGEFPVYRFPGGERIADQYELEHGSDNLEELK